MRLPADLRALVDYGVARLMWYLRYANPGINVRLPSHVNPPFRSVQFTFQQITSVTAATTSTTVTFNGQSVVPDGVRGVVSRMSFEVAQDNIDVLTFPQRARLTVVKNDQALPGFLDLIPGFTRLEELTDVSGAQIEGASISSPAIVSPITLEPGDRLQTQLRQIPVVGVAFDAYVTLQGWLYPIEVEADGIVGTLADRGGSLASPK